MSCVTGRSRAAQKKTVDTFMQNTQHMAPVALDNVSLAKTGPTHLLIRDGSFCPLNVMRFAAF